ncbi:hypothetical protein BRADI_4g24570v3 [Brachypodium distachyon]|uniref:Serpin domain-containing protein n=1 Tax=Brachypodium distachyon TaxID=15368 RepID=A0A0Q3EP95_BRADI|nr:hypothetical protein BRADI_4g24570v3 [Brachypodium distachyon]
MKFRSAVKAAGEGLAALSAGLARRLADEDAYRSNLVFSPLSIYTPLALAAAGARGATLDELLRMLGARSQGELAEFLPRAAALMRDRSVAGGPRVASACGVWSDLSCPLKPGFVEASGKAGNTEIAAVDFQGKAPEACRRINVWAKRETLVVLGNAVYFKGKWEQPFDKSHTEHEPFRRLGGAGEVEVPVMRSRKAQFVAVHRGFKVLKLRYKMADDSAASSGRDRDRTQFSMCIFLPDADDGLPGLIESIASRPSFLHEHLPCRPVHVSRFRVPRFKLSFHDSLVAVLQQLGLVLPFSNVADFSDMAECPIKLDEVIHKAVLEVNEEGTKAAAVTMEDTGAVVFAGQVVDPSRE